MIRLGDVRKDLEKYDYCEIIYNLDRPDYNRFEQDYVYVFQLLEYPDDYEIPYSCYEIIYDWDDYGYGDGMDVICFYDNDTGFLAKDEKARKAYGKLMEE